MKKGLRYRVSVLLVAALAAATAGVYRSKPPARAMVEFDQVLPTDPTDLESGNYRLTGHINVPITIADDAVVNIDLNGFSVDGGDLGSAITVGDDAKLGLYDTVGTGRITGKKGTRHSEMVGGAGVYVNDDATFEMYGGTIEGCEVTATDCAAGGAGVYVKDGAVFRMSGGTITDCHVTPSSGEHALGGAVYGAGPIYLSGGTIEKSGGSATHGGAIYAGKSLYISGNVMIRDNTAAAGGAVYVLYGDLGSVFDMSGGIITDNTAEKLYGSGVFVAAGAMRLSGSADISRQKESGEDIRYAKMVSSNSDNLRLCHQNPAKNGFIYELHADSSTGTDVTAAYESGTFRTVPSQAGFYTVWRYTGVLTSATPTTVTTKTPSTEMPTPDVTNAPTLTPTVAPTLTPTVAPTLTPVPETPEPTRVPVTATPLPTVTPSYGPGEGRESAEYRNLSDGDRTTADDLVKKEPTISYVTAASMVKEAAKYGVSKSELLLTDSSIRSFKGIDDPAGTSFGRLTARITKRANKSLTLSWKKVKNADGYLIYGNLDGKKHAFKLIAGVGSNTKSKKITGLKKGKEYKYIVIAYHRVDQAHMTMTASVIVHAITSGNKKYTSVRKLNLYKKSSGKRVKLKSTEFRLSSKGSMRINAQNVLTEKGKTLHEWRSVRYESSAPSVLKVSAAGGKLTPVKAGKAIVYAYSQSGCYKKITITVRAAK